MAASFQEEPAAFAPLAPAPTGLPALRAKHVLARLAGGPLATARPAPTGVGTWAVYPNPLPGGTRALRLAGLTPGTPVRVTDTLGRTVAQGTAGAGVLALPPALAPGLYLVQAQGQVRRLLVE